jgi:hypothetical protein
MPPWVVQDPFRMGYEGIKTQRRKGSGECRYRCNVITKENMNTERSKELLTPDVTK